MSEQVGIIGQMYENRKTHANGVLESRDEKCRTLLFRDAEGKSFNITYSTFKSTWRKYVGEDEILTSSQKEANEKLQEKQVEIAKEIASAPRKADNNADRRKPALSKVDKAQLAESCKILVDDAILHTNSDLFKLKSKNEGCVVKYKNHRILEVWPKINLRDVGNTVIYTTNEILDASVFDKKVGVFTVEVDEGSSIPAKFTIKTELLDSVLKSMMAAATEIYTKKAEDEARAKAEKEAKANKAQEEE